MSLPVARYYKLPLSRPLSSYGDLLSTDLLLTISSAEDILAQAEIKAQQVQQDALERADIHMEQAQAATEKLAAEAALAAQREVWQSVLGDWMAFREGLRAKNEITRDLLQQLCSMVLKKLRTHMSADEKLESSIACVLDHWMESSKGVLCTHVEEVTLVQNILHRIGRKDVLVRADTSVAKGACVLRCGDLSFSTDFNENIDTLTTALNEVLQMIDEVSC